MKPLTPLLFALALLIPSGAHSFQDPAPVAAALALEEVAAPEPVPAATVHVAVRVELLSGLADHAPRVGADVQLHILQPPHEVVRTLSAIAGDDGIAHFEVEPQPGLQGVPEVDDGRRFFGETIELGEAGERTGAVSIYRETTDASVIIASNVVTIVELWEEYITFTQVFTFRPREQVIYAPDREDPTSFLRIPVPENAEGIRVARPEEDARVVTTDIAFAGEIAPPGVTDHRGPHLVIQYSIPSDNRSTMAWEQPMVMEVERLSVVVPQGSSFLRHQSFNVEVDVPMCEGGPTGTSVCFDLVTDDPEGIPLQEDVDVVVARAVVREGQVLRVSTSGWPAPVRWKQPAAAGVAVLAALMFLLLFVRDRGARAEDAHLSQITSLNAQKESLLDAAAEVEHRLDDGLMLEKDAEIARRRIREQLGVVYRRLREFEAASGEG
ncbi:MAG: hypothetical protein ACJAYU_004683 [Bradymonadia bacterium]|jgi:hypothetical protein